MLRLDPQDEKALIDAIRHGAGLQTFQFALALRRRNVVRSQGQRFGLQHRGRQIRDSTDIDKGIEGAGDATAHGIDSAIPVWAPALSTI
jgi:hypothetical protein